MLKNESQKLDSEQICHMARVTGRNGHDVKSTIARSQMEVLEAPSTSDGLEKVTTREAQDLDHRLIQSKKNGF